MDTHLFKPHRLCRETFGRWRYYQGATEGRGKKGDTSSTWLMCIRELETKDVAFDGMRNGGLVHDSNEERKRA